MQIRAYEFKCCIQACRFTENGTRTLILDGPQILIQRFDERDECRRCPRLCACIVIKQLADAACHARAGKRSEDTDMRWDSRGGVDREQCVIFYRIDLCDARSVANCFVRFRVAISSKGGRERRARRSGWNDGGGLASVSRMPGRLLERRLRHGRRDWPRGAPRQSIYQFARTCHSPAVRGGCCICTEDLFALFAPSQRVWPPTIRAWRAAVVSLTRWIRRIARRPPPRPRPACSPRPPPNPTRPPRSLRRLRRARRRRDSIHESAASDCFDGHSSF
jgi:hypothetical protein